MHRFIQSSACWIVLLVIQGISVASHAQQQDNFQLKIGEEQLLTKIKNKLSWTEPVIGSDPSDPNFLIVTAFNSNITDYLTPTNSITVLISSNGGKKWKSKELECHDCTDPWITITNKGIIFLTVMGKNPDDLSGHFYNILSFTSTDKGQSWTEKPQFIQGTFDGPKTTAGIDGSLYLVSQTYSRNRDSVSRHSLYVARAEPGETDIKPLQKLIPSNLGFNGENPAVTGDGSLFISYFDYMRKANGGFRTRESRLKGRRAWVVKSSDRGETFSEALFITEEAAFRPNSFAAAANTANFNNGLYFASMNESLRDIIFLYSPDGGDEWIQTKLEDSSDRDRSRFFPQIAINSNGVVAVAWMDFRDSDNPACYAPYIAISIDGGKSFSIPQRVASEFSCPDANNSAPAKRWNVGGDYFGLTSSIDGRFHVVWPDARTGFFELRYASIQITNQPGK